MVLSSAYLLLGVVSALQTFYKHNVLWTNKIKSQVSDKWLHLTWVNNYIILLTILEPISGALFIMMDDFNLHDRKC